MRKTRKSKAAELLRLVTEGPSYSFDTFGHLDKGAEGLTKEQRELIQKEFERQTRMWLSSWVAPLCDDLIPEVADCARVAELIARYAPGGSLEKAEKAASGYAMTEDESQPVSEYQLSLDIIYMRRALGIS